MRAPSLKALTTPAAKAMIAFVVVVIALVFALWPRDSGPSSAPAGRTAATGTQGLLDQPVSDSQLAQARAAAALAPCPNDDAAPGPDAVLRDVGARCVGDGSMLDLGRATAGKPLVINMWAVWCLPCRKELPYFDQLRTDAGERLNVLGVHASEGAGRPYSILKFLQEVGVHLPVVTDDDGAVAKAVGAPRVFPSTVLVRADGTVAKVLPQVFATYDELAAAVRDGLGVDVTGGR